jgi:hypothetical protein
VRARGGRLAVDDAGAGYAGLKHVMRIAPDLIKLDRSIVAGVHGDPARAALVASFVRYARDSNATVCAEGIETLDDLVRLADLDVTYGQGYAIAPPAAPWAIPDPEAARACATSFIVSLSGAQKTSTGDLREHSLEHILLEISQARTHADLAPIQTAIADELGADEAAVFWWPSGRAEWLPVDATRAPHASAVTPPARWTDTDPELGQLLVGDSAGDPRVLATMQSQGWNAALRIPLVWHHRIVGLLEAYNLLNRPWSRFEIRRARMISHHLAAALETIERNQATVLTPSRR